METVELQTKPLPPIDDIEQRRPACDDRILAERLERLAMLRSLIGEASVFAMPIWLWQVGDALLLGTPSEAHSPLQTGLRRRFPGRAIGVMNIVNGYCGYLPPAGEYSRGCYQSEVALFEFGCLEQTIAAAAAMIAERFAGQDQSSGMSPASPAPIP